LGERDCCVQFAQHLAAAAIAKFYMCNRTLGSKRTTLPGRIAFIEPYRPLAAGAQDAVGLL
jgi:hypothetical protein